MKESFVLKQHTGDCIVIRMAESHQETGRSVIEDFQLEKGADSECLRVTALGRPMHRVREGRHWNFVLLAALLIPVGTVAADDGVRESKFLEDLIVGYDFSEGQGATAYDVQKTGTDASLKQTVWLNTDAFANESNEMEHLLRKNHRCHPSELKKEIG